MKGSCLTSKGEAQMETGLSAGTQVRKTVYCKVEGEESHTLLTLRGTKKTQRPAWSQASNAGNEGVTHREALAWALQSGCGLSHPCLFPDFSLAAHRIICHKGGWSEEILYGLTADREKATTLGTKVLETQ